MKNASLIFIISALIGLGIGYLFFDLTDSKSEQEAQSVTKQQIATNVDEKQGHDMEGEGETTVNAKGDIFVDKGCIQCHSISKLNLKGGATGPDLSNAYATVEGKHGKKLDEFLQEPTSAVMSGVIKGNPLTDEERAKVVEALKSISEQ